MATTEAFKAEGWVGALRDLLGSTDSRLCGDFDNFAVIIAQLFKKVTNPPISVRNGVKVEVPANYTIKIGGSRRLYSILGDPELFGSLPLNLRKGILDLMSLLLSRGTTYVVRFQCHNTETAYSRADSGGMDEGSSESLTKIFLALLDRSRKDNASIDVSKRIVHLVGLTAAAGLSISDNRDVLALLQRPSELTVSLLQALKNMTRMDNSIVKANPGSFFNLGGQEAGITSGRMNFPFNNKEYQFITWFRVEEFENTKLNWAAMHGDDSRRRGSGVTYGQTHQDAGASHAFRTTQHHVVSMLNAAGKGFDLFIQDKVLHYYVSFSNDESLVIKLDGLPLRRGVWYHVAVTHQRASRLSMFAKDELTIHIDHKVAYQSNIRYPSDPSSPSLEGMKFEVGANFDGQISPVYFFKDALEPREVEMVARADAGKPIDSRAFQVQGGEKRDGGSSDDAASSLPTMDLGGPQQQGEAWDHSVKYMDLMDTLSVSGKTVAIYSKVATAYHPARCMYNHALDVQGGRHAMLGRRTQAWNIFNVRDMLGSLGGISCILPMFPRLLIDRVGSGAHDSSRPSSPRMAASSDAQPQPQPKTRENPSNSVTSLPSPMSDVGFGTSWGDVYSGDSDSGYDLLDDSAKEELRAEMIEVEEDTCIALILEILSNLLQHHRIYQREMLAISGPDMIEYALTCVSNEVLAGEGERCVLSLHGLCTAVQELPALHTKFIRSLFLNLHIWWRSSFHMQSSLMHLVMASLKKEPAKYSSLIDIHDLLTAMYAYYREVDEEEVSTPARKGDAGAGSESFNKRLSVVRSNSIYREIATGNRVRTSTEESFAESVSTEGGEGDEVRRRAMTEESVRSRLLSDESAALSNHINFSLDNQQRKSLRWCIQSIIMAVVESSQDPLRYFQCLLDFIAVCKDLVVLDEVAQMLLIFIVEGGGERANSVIGSIIEACHGPEEFTSFILRYVVHRPSEELRCTGIRIITHFYLRLGKVSPALSKISLKNKRHGSNLVAMAVERLQDLGRGAEDPGLKRLQVCGGMALLTEVVTSHADSSTINTYAALLEMLLTKPGDVSDVTIMHKNVFDEKLTPHLGGNGSGVSNDLTMTMKVSQFTARYMQPDHFDESEESALNMAVLPVFLELLPKLTLGSAQQHILSDLLSLLKHSESNREVFCGSVAWHMSMFDIVSRYVIIQPSYGDEGTLLRFSKMGQTLEKWAQHTAWLMARAKNQPVQEAKSALLNRMEQQRKYAGTLSQSSLLAAEAMKLREEKKNSKEEDKDEEDTWFAIGMKVYATLLLHALQAKEGWHEVGRTLSLSLANPTARIVHFAVLSHLVNELTFIMQWRYRELQRLASSSNTDETSEALSYLDNIFSVFITTGQHVIVNNPSVTAGIYGWGLAKLRIMYLKEVIENRSRRKTEGGAYSDDSDNSDAEEDDEAHRDDEYLYELAEAMLVERATIRKRRDSINKKSSEDDIPHPEYSGADIGLGSTIISLDKNEKASMHPYLKNAENFLDFSEHVWVDLGNDKNVSVSAGSGASAALEAGRKRFTVSEFLHPLGRTQEIPTAQLILLLQNLRFFDVFFWPSDELPLRNSPMLRFHKEKPASEDEEEQGLEPPLTICMSVMCQAFYVLQKLSPTNDLAELNVNRIHAVIESMDNVSRYATPVDDLLLATLVHLTTAMQTVAQSLQPFFEMIGITEPVKIINIGLSSVEDDDREDQRVADEERRFDSIYEDPSTCRLVEEYFDTAPGTNVLHFVRAVALALVSLMDMRKELLSEAMDEFAFNCLESLVDRINFDLDFHLKAEQAKAQEAEAKRRSSVGTAQVKFRPAGAATVPGSDSSGSLNSQGGGGAGAAPQRGAHAKPTRAATRPRDTGLPEDYSYSIGSVHGGGGDGGAYSPTEDQVDMIEDPDQGAGGRRGSLDARDSVTEYGDIFEMGSSSKKEKGGDNTDRASGDSSSPSRHYSRMKPKERSRGHSLQEKLRGGGDGTGSRRRASTTPTGASRVEDGARTSSMDLGDMAHAFDQSSGYHGVDHAAHFSGQLIVKMMQWLRDLYFSCNLNRSVGVVKSLMQLEYHEMGSQRGYQSELRVLGKTVLEASSYLSEKNLEEMSDLNNLSAFVAKRMGSRHAARNRTKAATDNLKLKSVAKRWNDNMRIFGAEWSPWRGESAEEKEQADGVALHELSRHKDSMMRRMVMAPLEYGVDHRDEAYSEGKERDQIMFELGLDPKTDKLPPEMEGRLRMGGTLDGIEGAAGGGDGDSEAAAAPFTDILKNVQIKTAAAENDKEWGDSDDDDEDDIADESMLAALNPSTVAGSIFTDDLERERGDDGEDSMVPGHHHPLHARGMNPLTMLGGITNKGSRPEWAIGYQWGASERSITVVEASRITLDKVMSGQLLLTNKHLYFHPRKVVGGLAMAGKAKNSALISFHDRRWNIEGLSEVYGRRYLLQNCAIEFFFSDGAEAFFAFDNPGTLQKFFRAIRRLHTPLLRTPRTLNPRSLIRNCQYTDLWRRRQISNFEYLMVLNVMAGRSFNDITQYPVFPWVIADYTSQALDLSGKTPGVFRDLSKPIGAINPDRLQEILERYRSFDEDTPEQLKFMYGSHYSSAGVVVHYLLRQEPFTSLAINLQGGRFDCPDRLFFSIKNCWEGVNTSVSDVKELIPELYSCPEVFMNSNRLPLGELQEGGKVDDVVLPPWAHGSPFEFVRQLRDALESDYVSENLHHWIDLIFGYQQQGPEAIKAHNLFYYLTYENSVDIEAIDDPLKREAAKTQVIHFGQTPSQLFKSAHEPRLPRQECITPVCSDRSILHRLTVYTPNEQLGKEGSHGAVIDVRCTGDKLATLHADLTVCSYQWSAFPDGNGSPFDIRPLKARTLPCAPQSRSEDILERRSYVPQMDGSNDDTSTSNGTGSTGAAGSAQAGTQAQSSSSSNDMLKKFSRGISRGFSFLKEAANTNAPGTAPSLGNMGLAEAEDAPPSPRNGAASPSSLRLDQPALDVDGHSLPPPPSAYDDSGNPMTPATPATHSVTSPRRLSTGSLGHRGSVSSSTSSTYGEANCANGTPGSTLADRLTGETGVSVDSQGSNDRDSESTFSPRSITSNTASGVRLALPQTNHHHVALDMAGGKVISCGYWDHTLKVHTLDSFKTLTSSKGGHVGAITCLDHGTDHSNGTIIATGGEDGTVRIWADRDRQEDLAQLSDAVDPGNRFRQNEMRAVCTLWGHTSAVTCLSYSPDLDLALSASSTGLLCVHSVRKGQYLRSLRYLEGRNIVSVLATGAGYLLVSTSDEKPSSGASGAEEEEEEEEEGSGEVSTKHELHLFWINGQHLKSMPISSKVSATALNRSRDMLAVGGEDGSLQIVILNSLEFMCEFGLTQHGSVSSLWFSVDRQFLMVGSQDGTFHIMLDPQAAFAKAQGQLQKTAILGAL